MELHEICDKLSFTVVIRRASLTSLLGTCFDHLIECVIAKAPIAAGGGGKPDVACEVRVKVMRRPLEASAFRHRIISPRLSQHS